MGARESVKKEDEYNIIENHFLIKIPPTLKLWRTNKNTMATTLLELNNLNLKAMNKKIAIRYGRNYHTEGIGTVTILMAAATVVIIFYSIYSSIPA